MKINLKSAIMIGEMVLNKLEHICKLGVLNDTKQKIYLVILYMIKYLKYKKKYLILKKQYGSSKKSESDDLESENSVQDSIPGKELDGSASLSTLNPDVNIHIKNFTNCKEIINLLSTSKDNNIQFDTLVSPINTTLDLVNPNKHICSHITDPIRRDQCNIYYNKCYLKHLFNKFLPGQPEPANYDVNTLNKILLRSIPNNNNDQERPSEQNSLIAFGSTLTIIGYDAFAYKRLVQVTIPNSVTTIRDYAFTNNQLVEVIIPNSVTHIGVNAFAANRLVQVTIPNSVTTIGNYAFAANRLVQVTIPNSVTTIRNYAFTSNQLVQVTIPNSVTHIGNNAFRNNELVEVTIPNSVTHIDDGAFTDNQLVQVTIPNSVIHIGDGAFTDNQLVQVTIPNRFRNQTNIFGNNQNITFTYT
jgi:hypothetical protein